MGRVDIPIGELSSHNLVTMDQQESRINIFYKKYGTSVFSYILIAIASGLIGYYIHSHISGYDHATPINCQEDITTAVPFDYYTTSQQKVEKEEAELEEVMGCQPVVQAVPVSSLLSPMDDIFDYVIVTKHVLLRRCPGWSGVIRAGKGWPNMCKDYAGWDGLCRNKGCCLPGNGPHFQKIIDITILVEHIPQVRSRRVEEHQDCECSYSSDSVSRLLV